MTSNDRLIHTRLRRMRRDILCDQFVIRRCLSLLRNHVLTSYAPNHTSIIPRGSRPLVAGVADRARAEFLVGVAGERVLVNLDAEAGCVR